MVLMVVVLVMVVWFTLFLTMPRAG